MVIFLRERLMGRSSLRSVAAYFLAFGLAAIVVVGQAPTPPPPGGPGLRAAGPPPPPPPSPEAIKRAEDILAEARKAIGGDKLAAVKTVVANGRTRRLRGNNIQPIEFEISIELPDRYMRRDEFPAEESDPTSSGFNGAALIQLPAPPTPPPGAARPGGPPPPSPEQVAAQRAQRVNVVKQDFVRFALGMFPGSFETYPLTFAFAAQAQAPQGRADVLSVRGAGNFAARLFISSETHLPIMVSWELPPSNVIVMAPGQPPPATVAPGAVIVTGPAALPATATQEQKDAYAKEVAAIRAKAQATPVEHRLYFADYRDADGLMFPFRLRRAIGADTTEETTFDRFRINTRIDPRRFQVQ